MPTYLIVGGERLILRNGLPNHIKKGSFLIPLGQMIAYDFLKTALDFLFGNALFLSYHSDIEIEKLSIAAIYL